MKIINNLNQIEIVKKITIKEFVNMWNLENKPHSKEIFDKFIKKYDIDCAIENFTKDINHPYSKYEDHQRVFYSSIRNSVIVTVQPYSTKNEELLINLGFKKDSKLSWHYPESTELYILEICQMVNNKNSIEILKSDISHIIKKNDVWLVFTNCNKLWITEINGITENGIFCTLKLATKEKV